MNVGIWEWELIGVLCKTEDSLIGIAFNLSADLESRGGGTGSGAGGEKEEWNLGVVGKEIGALAVVGEDEGGVEI